MPYRRRRRGRDRVYGFLNVHKPIGPTSHDLVDAVRRLGKLHKVGHLGTLDPMAEGVLPLAVGMATRLSPYLMDVDKVYQGVIRLGIETDTYDGEGRVVAERPVPQISLEALEKVLDGFRGEIQQRVPPFSAVKRGGKRLYERARAGEEVPEVVRTVVIYRLDVLRWEPPELEVRVHCSKGTFLRGLAHDIGRALGCGGHLASLVRLRSGPFRIETAVPWAELEAALKEGTWTRYLIPLHEPLGWPQVEVTEVEAQRLRQGQDLYMDDLWDRVQSDWEWILATRDGKPLAVLHRQGPLAFPRWHPERVLR